MCSICDGYLGYHCPVCNEPHVCPECKNEQYHYYRLDDWYNITKISFEDFQKTSDDYRERTRCQTCNKKIIWT